MTRPRSERFVAREQRALRRELLISPHPELGLVAMDGPNDPEPGLEIEDGHVVAMDGRRAEDFDVIDRFVALYGFTLDGLLGRSVKAITSPLEIELPEWRARVRCGKT